MREEMRAVSGGEERVMAWARLHALAPKSRTEGKWRLIS